MVIHPDLGWSSIVLLLVFWNTTLCAHAIKSIFTSLGITQSMVFNQEFDTVWSFDHTWWQDHPSLVNEYSFVFRWSKLCSFTCDAEVQEHELMMEVINNLFFCSVYFFHFWFPNSCPGSFLQTKNSVTTTFDSLDSTTFFPFIKNFLIAPSYLPIKQYWIPYSSQNIKYLYPPCYVFYKIRKKA